MVDMVNTAMVTLGCDPGSLTMPTAMPLYEQLAELYRAKIRSGELRPGDRLPSTSALKADGWKQNAIVSAMRILRVEGWTRGQPGQAVFVADRPPT
jgi:DNA-binding transcriptional regulator YhcF (GntR family)